MLGRFVGVIMIIMSVCVVALLIVMMIDQTSSKHGVNLYDETVKQDDVIRYLPLGDGYTIGLSVEETNRWPRQLTKAYKAGGKRLKIIENPSKANYDSQDLIDFELRYLEELKPDFVSIQIGRNDYLKNVGLDRFEKNMKFIVEKAQKEITDPDNILLLTIPYIAEADSNGQSAVDKNIAQKIQQYNRIIINIAKQSSLPVADIFPTSLAAASDRTLVTGDSSYPSAKQYRQWTEVIIRALNQAHLDS